MEGLLRYSVTAPKQPGNIVVFGFSMDGILLQVNFNPDASAEWKKKVFDNIPYTGKELKQSLLNGFYLGCEVLALTEVDLSFDSFWAKYKYKVGDKKRVGRKWGELPEEDKMMAIAFIRRYRNWCDRKKIEYCYPETYLNQRRWENHID